LCISWTNKRFDDIKLHGATVEIRECLVRKGEWHESNEFNVSWSVRASSCIPISRPTDATCDRFLLTFICLRRSYISYDLVHRIFTAQVRDVTPGPLTVTDTYDAVRKQKKAEYNKQYRLKRKLLLQASTSTETELAEKQKKAQ
jgi:hypothetical protein